MFSIMDNKIIDKNKLLIKYCQKTIAKTVLVKYIFNTNSLDENYIEIYEREYKD